jgi:hypothetical protein
VLNSNLKTMKKQLPNQEAINLKKEIEKIRIKADILYGKTYEMSNRLEEICLHDDTELKHEYERGGYLERAVYINKVVCKVCGKVINEERIIGSFE